MGKKEEKQENINIEIPKGKLGSIVAGIIEKGLTDEAKENLATKVVEDFLKAKRIHIGNIDRSSELMHVFKSELEKAIRASAREYLQTNPEVLKRMMAMVEEGIKRALDHNQDRIVENITMAIVQGVVRIDTQYLGM